MKFLVTASLALFFVRWASWSAEGPSQVAAGDWLGFRGPGGQGVSQARGLPVRWSQDENILWKTPLPGAGGSSPIVVGDRIFLTAYSGYAVPGEPAGSPETLQRHVLCLRRADGTVLWRKDVPAAQPEQSKVRDHGYASSSPVADKERVYVFFGKSGVFAYTHDGRALWRADVGGKTHGWGSAASPVLLRDLLVVNASVESDSLVALDRRTGKEVWREGGMKESWNTPIVTPGPTGKEELVVAIFGQVLGFDPLTGERLWSCETGIGWYMVPSVVSHGDVVYCIGGRSGGGLAVRLGGRGNVTQSHRLWTMPKGSNVSSPLYHDGHLYFLHENLGVFYCVEARTGRVVFEERVGRVGQIYSSPILADGRIYAVGRQGTVVVLAAQPDFMLLATNEMGDRGSFDASPAIDGRHLLIRSDRFLYCIGSR